MNKHKKRIAELEKYCKTLTKTNASWVKVVSKLKTQIKNERELSNRIIDDLDDNLRAYEK